jgi:hypothetical protein
VLDFLLFVLILLVLTVGPVVGIFYLSEAMGWGLHHRPIATILVTVTTVILLVDSFGWLFSGCRVTGLAFHGAAMVHCPH